MCSMHSESEIDGEAFCHLSREDIGTIFPNLSSSFWRPHLSPDLSNASSDILSYLDETFSRSKAVSINYQFIFGVQS